MLKVYKSKSPLLAGYQCERALFKILIWEQASVRLGICFYVYSHALANFPEPSED